MIELEERPPTSTTTFIAVPGFCRGGWAWDAVAEPLRDDGFVVDGFHGALADVVTAR
ncbi:hypothetical protein [Microbacterium pumilum]|uniref:hypothetical protein n=1 Tax=Microbacterium pumilum TaxID=344165 RepID=UPI0031D685BD